MMNGGATGSLPQVYTTSTMSFSSPSKEVHNFMQSPSEKHRTAIENEYLTQHRKQSAYNNFVNDNISDQ